tara:strand:+ start:805 stop:1455 length:651 start_codon:yes stop_codon:yes gene_type:complete
MKQQFFGMPIWREKIDSNLYNKKEIIDTIIRNYRKDRSRNTWWSNTSNLHHMYDDWDNKDYEVPDWNNSLMGLYKGVLQRFFNTIDAKFFNFDFDITNYTCYGNLQYIQEHLHPQTDFVGIHYIRFDTKSHTPTRFINPMSYAKYLEDIRCETRLKYNDNDISNAWMFPSWELEVIEDDMIIHPALLAHDVRPQTCNDDNLRIASVLNINVYNASI